MEKVSPPYLGWENEWYKVEPYMTRFVMYQLQEDLWSKLTGITHQIREVIRHDLNSRHHSGPFFGWTYPCSPMNYAQHDRMMVG